ncbi:IlvGEDA operon leader peptide [Plesiomonas shigelloides]|uniref:ilv operon leader peptide n=1 Tax=Plesiomonas shigelloides TaxID=703 RepID=A0A8I2B143_PLESH|nr:IlvGEDA operon leader peptide [Plesiomonas shigelloides]MCX9458393.1 IlvGEDA operon leader peptide [Vibrio cholerae]KAB7664433.1 IlvGEDA operon leader peptide [Plesiomonas shigelloides]KAB7664629.1 IlvGEDA operon leader peptide [Plesiomonas shigelloides]KAB7675566.1 IlvGEDA operon leader peptide [Plesiomonas shigelloides]
MQSIRAVLTLIIVNVVIIISPRGVALGKRQTD